MRQTIILPGDPAWQELLTASQIAPAIGVHPYTSRQEQWRQFTNHTSIEDNPAMQWGRDHEAVAVNAANSVLRDRVGGDFLCNSYTYVNHFYPRLGATPDALLTQKVNIYAMEVKCPYNGRARYTPWLPHLIQCYTCMALLYLPDYYLVYWTPEEITIHELHFSTVFQDLILPWVEEFLAFDSVPPRFPNGERELRERLLATFLPPSDLIFHGFHFFGS